MAAETPASMLLAGPSVRKGVMHRTTSSEGRVGRDIETAHPSRGLHCKPVNLTNSRVQKKLFCPGVELQFPQFVLFVTLRGRGKNRNCRD